MSIPGPYLESTMLYTLLEMSLDFDFSLQKGNHTSFFQLLFLEDFECYQLSRSLFFGKIH